MLKYHNWLLSGASTKAISTAMTSGPGEFIRALRLAHDSLGLTGVRLANA